MNRKDEVKGYFSGKAAGYDLVDTQDYWRLSDKLLWSLFDSQVLRNSINPEKPFSQTPFSFLDAGGGTGRWSEKVLKHYPLSTGTIYDFSAEMLAEARKKIKGELEGRLSLVEGDIQHMNLDDESQDVTFNFHNVLGFVESPERSLKEMARVTKKGGYVVSVIPNLYHCIFFNVMVGNLDEAEHAKDTGMGRFTSNMPYMHLFTPSSIESLYREAGLVPQETRGFPICIYPGYQETQITGNTQKLKDFLSDPQNFQRVYNAELDLILKTKTGSGRGNNLFAVAQKED